MRLTCAAAALAAVFIAGPALAGGNFSLSGANTKVEFVGTKPNGKHEGGFKALTGTATAAANDPASLKLKVEIDTTSLYSDNEKLTQHLKSPDFFGVKSNPKSTFVLKKVEAGKDGHTVTGDLTLLGVTKEIAFPARINVTENALTLASEFQIDRSAFGMTYGRGKVDDQVKLKVSVNATK